LADREDLPPCEFLADKIRSIDRLCFFTDQAKLKAWLRKYRLFILNYRDPRKYSTVPLTVSLGGGKIENLSFAKSTAHLLSDG
jgi:hypothetical protein